MRIKIVLIFSLILASCDSWEPNPQPLPIWTPVPTQTPQILTATPLIIQPPTFEFSATPSVVIITPVTPTNTEIPSSTPTFTTIAPTDTPPQSPFQATTMDILGCNTSIDILHGMGEVTNAYVTIKNIGTTDLPNTCGLLRAIDEGREHPDKKVCVSNLPSQNQVTFKLTVDSTYKQDTVIQVDVLSNDLILLRLDKQSCRDIDLFGGAPADIGIIKPVQ